MVVGFYLLYWPLRNFACVLYWLHWFVLCGLYPSGCFVGRLVVILFVILQLLRFGFVCDNCVKIAVVVLYSCLLCGLVVDWLFVVIRYWGYLRWNWWYVLYGFWHRCFDLDLLVIVFLVVCLICCWGCVICVGVVYWLLYWFVGVFAMWIYLL